VNCLNYKDKTKELPKDKREKKKCYLSGNSLNQCLTLFLFNTLSSV